MERRSRRLCRERPLRSGSERRRKLSAVHIRDGRRGWAPAVDASSIRPVAFASHHSRLVRAASRRLRRLLRRVTCLLRLSQGFVDALFQSAADAYAPAMLEVARAVAARRAELQGKVLVGAWTVAGA